MFCLNRPRSLCSLMLFHVILCLSLIPWRRVGHTGGRLRQSFGISVAFSSVSSFLDSQQKMSFATCSDSSNSRSAPSHFFSGNTPSTCPNLWPAIDPFALGTFHVDPVLGADVPMCGTHVKFNNNTSGSRQPTSCRSLSYVLDFVPSGSTIILHPGTYDCPLHGHHITKPLRIIGTSSKEVRFECAQKGRAFLFDNVYVSLSNLSIAEGRAQYAGGILVRMESDFDIRCSHVLSDLFFTHCSAYATEEVTDDNNAVSDMIRAAGALLIQYRFRSYRTSKLENVNFVGNVVLGKIQQNNDDVTSQYSSGGMGIVQLDEREKISTEKLPHRASLGSPLKLGNTQCRSLEVRGFSPNLKNINGYYLLSATQTEELNIGAQLNSGTCSLNRTFLRYSQVPTPVGYVDGFSGHQFFYCVSTGRWVFAPERVLFQNAFQDLPHCGGVVVSAPTGSSEEGLLSVSRWYLLEDEIPEMEVDPSYLQFPLTIFCADQADVSSLHLTSLPTRLRSYAGMYLHHPNLTVAGRSVFYRDLESQRDYIYFCLGSGEWIVTSEDPISNAQYPADVSQKGITQVRSYAIPEVFVQDRANQEVTSESEGLYEPFPHTALEELLDKRNPSRPRVCGKAISGSTTLSAHPLTCNLSNWRYLDTESWKEEKLPQMGLHHYEVESACKALQVSIYGLSISQRTFGEYPLLSCEGVYVRRKNQWNGYPVYYKSHATTTHSSGVQHDKGAEFYLYFCYGSQEWIVSPTNPWNSQLTMSDKTCEKIIRSLPCRMPDPTQWHGMWSYWDSSQRKWKKGDQMISISCIDGCSEISLEDLQFLSDRSANDFLSRNTTQPIPFGLYTKAPAPFYDAHARFYQQEESFRIRHSVLSQLHIDHTSLENANLLFFSHFPATCKQTQAASRETKSGVLLSTDTLSLLSQNNSTDVNAMYSNVILRATGKISCSSVEIRNLPQNSSHVNGVYVDHGTVFARRKVFVLDEAELQNFFRLSIFYDITERRWCVGEFNSQNLIFSSVLMCSSQTGVLHPVEASSWELRHKTHVQDLSIQANANADLLTHAIVRCSPRLIPRTPSFMLEPSWQQPQLYLSDSIFESNECEYDNLISLPNTSIVSERSQLQHPPCYLFGGLGIIQQIPPQGFRYTNELHNLFFLRNLAVPRPLRRSKTFVPHNTNQITQLSHNKHDTENQERHSDTDISLPMPQHVGGLLLHVQHCPHAVLYLHASHMRFEANRGESGGMLLNNVHGHLHDCSLLRNEGTRCGGGMAYSSMASASLSLAGAHVDGNTALRHGGALYTPDHHTLLGVDSGIFNDNMSPHPGAVVYSQGVVTFMGNARVRGHDTMVVTPWLIVSEEVSVECANDGVASFMEEDVRCPVKDAQDVEDTVDGTSMCFSRRDADIQYKNEVQYRSTPRRLQSGLNFSLEHELLGQKEYDVRYSEDNSSREVPLQGSWTFLSFEFFSSFFSNLSSLENRRTPDEVWLAKRKEKQTVKTAWTLSFVQFLFSLCDPHPHNVARILLSGMLMVYVSRQLHPTTRHGRLNSCLSS